MKKALLVIISMILVLSFVSCEKEESIIGSWYEEETNLRIRFKEDNTCEFDNQIVDYRVEDQNLIMIVDGVEQVMQFTIQNDELELTFLDGEDFSIYLKRIEVE